MTKITQTSYNTVTLTYTDEFGEERTEHFWCPPGGGYVRRETAHAPGALGQQVCERLASRGRTLEVGDPDDLLPLIRREWKAARAAERRERVSA